PTFAVPEPDANYVATITYQGHNGVAPAAGSTVPGAYVTSKTGFVMTQGTDPGIGSQTVWTYTMVRTNIFPLYFNFAPTSPGSIANPLLAPDPTGAFSIGVTMIPAVGNVFTAYTGLAQQTIFSEGTSSVSTN